MTQVVLITGVSSGIGHETARALAKAGYRVFGTARAPERVPALPGVELVALDVQDDTSVRRAVAAVLDQAGRIDIVINNAGVSLAGPIEATSDAEAKGLFETNFFGVHRVIRAVLPAMRRQRAGLIVNVSSVLGFLPAPFMGMYAASKHALEGFSETLDHEVRGFGIRVALVEPSFTRTQIDTNAARTAAEIPDYAISLESSTRAVRAQVSLAPPPSDVAEAVVRLLASKYRLRHPADGRARLLSVLRRFAPRRQVDRSLRQVFGLAA